ncbi:RNA polymerase sigma factor [Rhizobacter sp. SG703]|uniref:RNA polymerase sigma factor n=1 Tax=Rhizobacter sp. SG703 TaxID=2587140 RepID=UPI001446FC00|nr:RNA polymerase sigma factor [Rhizobacter sp. SG703]
MDPPTQPAATVTLPDRADPDRDIAATVRRESGRLGDFIRRRVRDPGEAEDILQDVLEEFVEAYRLPAAIEQVSAWLYRVARYRIVDRFRKKREQPLHDDGDPDDDESSLDLALPSPDAGPEAAYARSVLLDTLQQALDDLPANQREVFVAHELEGHSFKDMAARSGVPVNTLLARKRYAVLYLRSRLQPIYDELDD